MEKEKRYRKVKQYEKAIIVFSSSLLFFAFVPQ